MEIRAATPSDLARVAEIYNGGIAERVATFETNPRSVDDVAAWLVDSQPFLVADDGGRVIGWARVGRYSDRCVYDGVGDHAVYLDPAARGRRLGTLLLEALASAAERQGIYKLTSRIFTDNTASRAAHRATGFTEVGILRRHGQLDGRWKDCVLVERLLGAAAADAALPD